MVALKGTHETILERFLEDPSVARHWRDQGGSQTLHSCGLPAGLQIMNGEFDDVARDLWDVMPPSHLTFPRTLRTSLPVGKYFLCHAGVRPGIPLNRQSDEDLLWIRDDFLSSGLDFGTIVVHGHTPTESPEVLPNRINIDAGAVTTGRLTCAILENGPLRFLVTK